MHALNPPSNPSPLQAAYRKCWRELNPSTLLVLFLVACSGFFTYGPLLFSLIQSFQGGQQGFGLHGYFPLLQSSACSMAWLRSCLLASAVAITSTLLSFLATLPSPSLSNRRLQRFNQSLSYPLLGAPDILLALAWLVWLKKLHIPLGFPSLWIAHTTLCLPFCIRIFKSQLARLHPSILEAARDLGAKQGALLFKILVPWLRPAILSSLCIGFLFSMEDLVVSEFLTSPAFQTLPLYLENQLRLGPAHANHALTVLFNLGSPCLLALSFLTIRQGFRQLYRCRSALLGTGLRRWTVTLLTPLCGSLVYLAFKSYPSTPSIRLTLYALPGYITPELLEAFSQRHGVVVDVHHFHSTEEMASRLAGAPEAPCDLILASGHQLQSLQRQGLIRSFEQGAVDALPINPFFLNNPYDSQRSDFIPYVWGITGLATQAALADPHRLTRWQDLWNLPPELRLLCIDDAKELIALIDLQIPDLPPSEKRSLSPAWQAAGRALIQRTSVLAQENLQSYFLAQEVDVGMAWSGACLKAEAEGTKLRFIWPEEGVLLWLDGFFLPCQSRYQQEALWLIQHCFEPQQVQNSIQATGFASVHCELPTLLNPLGLQNHPLLNPEIQLKKAQFHWLKGEEALGFQTKVEALQWMKFGVESGSGRA